MNNSSGFALGEYVSLWEGLSELESDFLVRSCKQNHNRSGSELRKAAKRGAIALRVNGALQDTMVVAGKCYRYAMLGIAGIIIF